MTLELHGLEAGYSANLVLTGADLAVGSGELMVVIGGNGSGKSTLLRALYGLLAHSSGQLVLHGCPRHVDGDPAWRLAAGVRHVPQSSPLFRRLSVRANLAAQCVIAGLPPPGERDIPDWEWLEFGRQPGVLKRLGGALSGGEQRMIALASALLSSPRVLLLDEPTQNLASDAERQVWDTLGDWARLTGGAAVIVEQRMTHISRVADRVAIVTHGRVRELSRSEFETTEKLQRLLVPPAAPATPSPTGRLL